MAAPPRIAPYAYGQTEILPIVILQIKARQ